MLIVADLFCLFPSSACGALILGKQKNQVKVMVSAVEHQAGFKSVQAFNQQGLRSLMPSWSSSAVSGWILLTEILR